MIAARARLLLAGTSQLESRFAQGWNDCPPTQLGGAAPPQLSSCVHQSDNCAEHLSLFSHPAVASDIGLPTS